MPTEPTEYTDGSRDHAVCESHRPSKHDERHAAFGLNDPWSPCLRCSLWAGTLAHTHQQSFVNCDPKPQNILLTVVAARISDFGMAKNFQQARL